MNFFLGGEDDKYLYLLYNIILICQKQVQRGDMFKSRLGYHLCPVSKSFLSPPYQTDHQDTISVWQKRGSG